jgi:YidC/Oxa1 family membrane protein insertase
MDKRPLVLVAIFATGLFAVQTFFKSSAPAPAPVVAPAPVAWETEERYVLENAVQQVVFSNLGGSIAEINLALREPQDPTSVVRSLRADSELKEISPLNDRFPLLGGRVIDPATNAVSKLKQGAEGGYYPLLRRGLLSPSGSKESLLRPEWYALSLSTAEGPLTQPFQVREFRKDRIVFEWSESGKRITKTFSIGQPPLKDPYVIRARIDTAGDVGPLWISSGVPEIELVGGDPNPLLQYSTNTKGNWEAQKLDLPQDQSLLSSIYPGWVSVSNGFFSLIMNPVSEVSGGLRAQKVPAQKALSRLLLLPENQGWGKSDPGTWPQEPGEKWAGYRSLLPLGSKAGRTDLALFAGPLDETILAQVDETLAAERGGRNPEFSEVRTYYGFFSFVSAPFAKFMWWLMRGFYLLTSNWTLALLAVTIALRVMTWPLNSWAMRATAKAKALQPKLAELQKMFANNPQGLQIAQAQLYREAGVNPLAPLGAQAIQIPFLIGMIDLLRHAFPLRGAAVVPGWIDSLAAPDVLFSWSISLPLIGNALHLLPLLLAGLTWWQGKLMMDSGNTANSGSSDQQAATAATSKIMPLLLLMFFYHAASGLNLYWLFSSVLGILQQKLAHRRQLADSASTKVVPFNQR